MRRRIERKSSFGCNGFNQVCKDKGNVKYGRKKHNKNKEKEKILYLMYLVVRKMKIAVRGNQ